ncbi:MAG: DUF523 domain-containing protein [Bacillota bacterium]|nr:DUF523 domain-containing protein [Bacillota bacterium]
MEKILVSACLLGVSCRYDQKSKEDPRVLKLLDHYDLIPFCPEILGGLPTPRPPSEINKGRVINIYGKDLTKEYEKGAEEGLRLARLYGAKKAILKARSPSCGRGQIYDGNFCKRLVKGDGITARLFLKENIEVISEEEL